MSEKLELPALTWQLSQREYLLQGLVEVLRKEYPGIQRVFRRSLEKECLSKTELPAIIIDQMGTDYKAMSTSNDGVKRADVALVFDIQALSGRTKKDSLHNGATEAEYLFSSLARVLENNRTLICELEGEGAPQPHAHDAFFECSVAYPRERLPNVRVLVTVKMFTIENFRKRPEINFNTLILEAGPCPQEDPHTHTIEVNDV